MSRLSSDSHGFPRITIERTRRVKTLQAPEQSLGRLDGIRLHVLRLSRVLNTSPDLGFRADAAKGRSATPVDTLTFEVSREYVDV